MKLPRFLLVLSFIYVFTLMFPHHAWAIPYDCPGTTSQARKDYVCEMSSEFAPKAFNKWAELRDELRPSLTSYLKKKKSCDKRCDTQLTDCKLQCKKVCTNDKCTTVCTKNCIAKQTKCDNRCDTSTFGTSIRGVLSKSKSVIEMHQKECNKSAMAQACEQKEAQPYCSIITEKIKKYKSDLKSKKVSLNQKIESTAGALIAIVQALTARSKELTAELNKNKIKCKAKHAQKTTLIDAQTGEQLACMLPQYAHNLALSTLLAFDQSAPDASAMHSGLETRSSSLGAASALEQLDDSGPAPDLAGVTCEYCWKMNQKCDPRTSYMIDLGDDPESIEWNFVPQGVSGSSICTNFPSPITLKLDQVFNPPNLCPGYLYKASHIDGNGGRYTFSLLVQDSTGQGPTYMSVHHQYSTSNANYWIYGWQSDKGSDWYKRPKTAYFDQCDMSAAQNYPPVTIKTSSTN